MLQRLLLITLALCSLSASAQWQQTGSKVRYVNGLGIPTKDTAAGVSADSSQIFIRPADSSLYVKYKRTWIRVGGGGGSIGGSGTINYVPKFTASGFIGNSQIFDNGTNVGIGTASPVRTLTLSGSSAVYQNIQGGASSDVGLLLGPIGNDAVGRIVYSNANNNLQLWTNATQQVTILNTGNVGIGTASPATLLSLAGSTSTTFGISISPSGWNNARHRFTVPISGDESMISFNYNGSAKDYASYDYSHIYVGSGTLKFGTNGVEAFRVSPGARVLINTTTDNGVDKLQVSGSARVSGTGFIGSASDNGVDKLQVSNTSAVYTGLSIANTNAALKLIVNSLGNISIGTTAFTSMDFITNNTIRSTITAGGATLLNGAAGNAQDKLSVNGSAEMLGMKQAFVSKTGAYTATFNDYIIDCTSGTFTVTLPASASQAGRILIIKNSGAGTITVDGNASETIDGAATYSLSVQYSTVQIASDGTNWKIISKF